MIDPRTPHRGRSSPNATSMAWIAAIIALVLIGGAAAYKSGRNTSTSAVVPDAATGQSSSPKAPATNQ